MLSGTSIFWRIMTRSPRFPTAAVSMRESTRDSGVDAASARRCCVSISTGSRKSTDSLVTPPATVLAGGFPCLPRQPGERQILGTPAAMSLPFRCRILRVPRRPAGSPRPFFKRCAHRTQANRRIALSRPASASHSALMMRPIASRFLSHADTALYRAKSEGRNTYRFFEAKMGAEVRERRLLEHELRLAISRGELRLSYQPQQEAKTGNVVGFEALLRWNHLNAARFHRRFSSRLPRRPARSCRSETGCCGRRAAKPHPGRSR